LHLRLKIDESSEAPIYKQISEQIAALIKSGRLRRGEHLPPERELALQLKIARGTVKKAYESLVNQRYIVAARGRGSTVTLDTESEFPDESADSRVGSSGLTRANGDLHQRPVGLSEANSHKNGLVGVAKSPNDRENNQIGQKNGLSDRSGGHGVHTDGTLDLDQSEHLQANGIRGRNELWPGTEKLELPTGQSKSGAGGRESARGDWENNPAETVSDNVSVPLSRAEQADRILTDAIISLEDLGFNYKQINDLFGLMLARRREQVSRFAIASVDCNPEALGIYQKQLAMLTHMNTARILLTDLHAAASADAMLEPFDLILTTSNHVDELRKMAPKMSGKVVPVIVAPTQATLIALARLETGSRAGVLHQSGRFLSIIRGWLQKSGFQGDVKGFNTERETAEELEGFVSDRSVLVTPPGFAAQLSGEHLRVINRFRMNGGQLIDFEYQIERGSLLHLEELIRSLINKTRK